MASQMFPRDLFERITPKAYLTLNQRIIPKAQIFSRQHFIIEMTRRPGHRPTPSLLNTRFSRSSQTGHRTTKLTKTTQT